MIALDSSILIDLEKQESRTLNAMSRLNIKNRPLGLPSVVYSEIYFGCLNKSMKKQQEMIDYLDSFDLLNTNRTSSMTLSRLRKMSYSKGLPIPDMDLLIASIVMAHNATLVTKDEHFKDIEGIGVVVV
jgi:tRNA(fMet)-specific endonuclease VapC